jgi:L-alanine-DL-glutamate epimerase-like enolase superfamily enzyme
MQRRKFLKSIAATAAAAAAGSLPAFGALPKMKITRIRAYEPPKSAPGFNQIFNQSYVVVAIETDAGITGIGEGGSKDLLAPGASRLIGRDPQFIEHLWQDMNRGYFYPPGRERTDAIGALDLALWDIKGKALNVPVHQLLGGSVRNYVECYNTGGIMSSVLTHSRCLSTPRMTRTSA